MKRVVVFGGGEVGLRKARFFAREAYVTVVSRAFVPGFEALGENVDRISTEIGPEQETLIDGADFIIIATEDRELNDRLEFKAKMSGKYCNRADGVSSFLIPSTVERPDYIVAISTLGRSPAMSRFIKGVIEEKLGPEISAMIELQRDLREEAKGVLPDQYSRECYLRDILDDADIWNSLLDDPGLARKIALRKMGVGHADDL